ncbi:MAG TPA: DUF4350 domain-containing protein [Allosphingosinicella sp.]
MSATSLSVAQTQEADPNFKAEVERPAYRRDRGPVVAIDAAHQNFHTGAGRYEPFARLLSNDAYRIVAHSLPFTHESLSGHRVLVIANAGSRNAGPTSRAAFTEEECDAVRDWVRRGGSLLLIADHSPFGTAAQNLARRFGIRMGEGWVYEPLAAAPFMSTQILYSRENGRLGDHPITRGRNARERVNSVRAFTGQSLTLPPGATALMRLPPQAREVADAAALNAVAAGLGRNSPPSETEAVPVGDRVQGLAMRFGRGRIVVLGEAAMLSAQVVTLPQEGGTRTFTMGMSQPGIDNRQLALNIIHWLTRAR